MGGAAIFGLILLILGFILFAIGVYLYTSNDNNNLTTSSSNTEAYIFMILGGLFILIGIIALVYGAYEGSSSDTKKDKKSKKDKQIEKMEKQNNQLKIQVRALEKRNNDYETYELAQAAAQQNLENYTNDKKLVTTGKGSPWSEQNGLIVRKDSLGQQYNPSSRVYYPPRANTMTVARSSRF